MAMCPKLYLTHHRDGNVHESRCAQQQLLSMCVLIKFQRVAVAVGALFVQRRRSQQLKRDRDHF